MTWAERPLGEVATLQRGFDLPSHQRRPGRVPIVSSSGHSDVHAEAKVAAPGVVTGRYGTIGQVFFVTEPFWPLNTTLYVRDFQGNDPRFVYYLLHSVDFESCNDKSGVPGVNRNDLHRLLVNVPPSIGEQRAIAEVLGALDDKIELNRRMNHTLDEMASALFNSWFIDYDPVVAKAAGRKQCGMDVATAALFPKAFADDIPLGWRSGCIGDLLTLQRGIDITKAAQRPGRVPVVSSGGVASFHDTPAVRGPGVVIGRKGTLGTTFWIGEDFWPHDTTLWVKDFRGNDPLFVYYFLRSHEEVFLGMDNGTANPTLNRNHVHPMAAVVPEGCVVDAFATSVRPWHDLTTQNLDESKTLAALRDALLPKLLSGEVRLKQAEKLVGAAL